MKNQLVTFILFTFLLSAMSAYAQMMPPTSFEGKYRLTPQSIFQYTVAQENSENPDVYKGAAAQTNYVEAARKKYSIESWLNSYFGTFTTIFRDETGAEKFQMTQDNLYKVADDGRLGIRVLQVNDALEVDEDREIDRILKYVLYGDESARDDIFSIITYFHPEKYAGSLKDLSGMLRTEMGITHAGAYIGKGRTRNSPATYHGKKWSVDKTDEFEEEVEVGYPAHVSTISMRGVPQNVLNKNILITLRILNEGNDSVVFPNDYKFDHFATYNLKEVLEFYRAWVDTTYIRDEINMKLVKNSAELVLWDQRQAIVDGEYRYPVEKVTETTPFYRILKYMDEYSTYCNEHITLAINAGINIIHTEESYKEIWGEEIGKNLFKLAKISYGEIIGSVVPDEKTSVAASFPFPSKSFYDKFEPMWKRRIKNPAGKPLIENSSINAVGVGLAWEPQTTFDIMADFIHKYANFTEIGIVNSGLVILGFAPIFEKRLGLAPQSFIMLAGKFFYTMMVNDVRKYAKEKSRSVDKLKQYVAKIEAIFYASLKVAGQESLTKGKMGAAIEKMFEKINNRLPEIAKEPVGLKADIKALASRELTKKVENMTPNEIAWERFAVDSYAPRADGPSLVEQATNIPLKTDFFKQMKPGASTFVKYYTPPAIINKIAWGQYKKVDEDIKIITIGSVFDISEVELVKSEKGDIEGKVKNLAAKVVGDATIEDWAKVDTHLNTMKNYINKFSTEN